MINDYFYIDHNILKITIVASKLETCVLHIKIIATYAKSFKVCSTIIATIEFTFYDFQCSLKTKICFFHFQRGYHGRG